MGIDLVWAESVHQDQVEIGLHEGEVVVAPVPDNHIGLCLGTDEDAGVVDACVDDGTRFEIGFVFLELFNGTVGLLEVGAHRETLDALAETAITGRLEGSMVRSGPNNKKSTPIASARDAECITSVWVTSLYAKTT
jgi:hypothetical protein